MALPKVYKLTGAQTLADVPSSFDNAVDKRFDNGKNGAPVYYKRVNGEFVMQVVEMDN